MLIRDSSRAKILATALNLFAEQGYEATSVRMIAQAAEVAQGLLYNYFTSKESLLVAVVEQGMRDVRESFNRAEAETSDNLAQLIYAALAIVRNKRAFWKLLYAVRLQNAVIAELRDNYTAWTTEVRATIESYCTAAHLARPDIESAIVFALIDGIAQHYVLDPEHYPLDDVLAVVAARYKRLP